MTHPGPEWVEHAIWWHVYPLGFAGADTTGAGHEPSAGLDRVTAWLEHAVTLGLNGVALGPVFESGSHGYDTVDHYRIDARLGGRAAFDRLVAAAHERGIRILLDGVFNHVGRDFAELDGARAGWLRRGRNGDVETFEGHEALLALDHDNPAVATYVADVMNHWLDAGADGWRLDAAYAIAPDFWSSVLPKVRAPHPDAYVLGEMLHGDYADYVTRSGVDSVTQYELWKAIWSSLQSANFFELDHALRRHDGLLENFVPYTFVGNHDVTRLASQVPDERHRPHALALLMTLGGTPAIYYGDEFGALAIKADRIGGDDAIRPAYPQTPGDPLPFDTSAPDEVHHVHQHMIGLRRRHPWLHRARSETVHLANESIVLRVAGEGGSLVLALNLADAELVFTTGLGELLAGSADLSGGSARVPAHGWAVLA